MPIRFINRDEIFDIDVNGSIVKVKQMWPQSDLFLLNKHRMKLATDGRKEDLDAIFAILKKFIVEFTTAPDGWNVDLCLENISGNDLAKLMDMMVSKSAFDKDEEKN